MPIVDRREFGGRFPVKENSQRLANYRYLEVQLMEMIGGWSHTTPQLAFKAAFGTQVYDHAQAADQLGERLVSAPLRPRARGAGHRRVRAAVRAHLEPRRGHRPARRGVPRAGAASGEHLRLPCRRNRPAGRRAHRAAPATASRRWISRTSPGARRCSSRSPQEPDDRRQRARGAVRARAAAGGVRRGHRPGHRVTLAGLPQRARVRPLGHPHQARQGRLPLRQALHAAAASRRRGAVLVLGRSGRLQACTRPRTSGRSRASAGSSTSCSTARSRRPTGWAR